MIQHMRLSSQQMNYFYEDVNVIWISQRGFTLVVVPVVTGIRFARLNRPRHVKRYAVWP